ncbi:hypothetical protein BD626DRAFT_573874 [Schizophyllum amplum]|uniref:Uncharacterized protein n=1 Tax=Schizophyllum amplum TaxID=97359 RepID=A0A550BZT0_9AGAR|nr:hypothetical protein BD626DRAFT_573874 [Auriculariopsis ampla]
MLRAEKTPASVAEARQKEHGNMERLDQELCEMRKVFNDLHTRYPRAFYDTEDTDARDAEERAEGAMADEPQGQTE